MLTNSGTIEGSEGIINMGDIDELVDSGTITGVDGSDGIDNVDGGYGIDNSGGDSGSGTIGMLIDAGEIVNAGSLSFTNSGSLSNNASLTVNNRNGTIATLVGAGLYNDLSGVTITNKGTIIGVTPTNVTVAGNQPAQTISVGLYNDTSGGISVLTNSGTIAGTGSAGYGIYNLGTINVLADSGTIQGASSDIFNSGTIGALIDVGQIVNAGSLSITNNGSLSSNAPLTVNNTGGTITTLVGAGLYNDLSGVTVTNNGNIASPAPANVTVTGSQPTQTIDVGLYNDTSGSITMLANSGTIAGTGSIGYGIYNVGAITTLSNSGTITGATDALYLGSQSSLGTLNNVGLISGNIDNQGAQSLTITGGMGSDYGVLTGYAGATGTITSASGVIFRSGNITLNDNINSNGIVADSGAMMVVNSQVGLSGANMFTVTGGTLEVGDSQNPSADLTSNVTVSGTGILRGHGTVTGNVTNDATVYPGGSIGILHVDGNYIQNSNGVLEVDITVPQNNAAPVAGVDYDQLAVTGTATLDGTLNINLDSAAFENKNLVGMTYDVITARSISGAFGTVSLVGSYSPYLTVTSGTNAGQTIYELTISPRATAFTSSQFYGSSLYAQNASLFSALSSPDGTDAGYWLHGLGSFGHAPQANYNYKGFVIGRGFSLNPHLILGGAVSNIYANTTGNAGSNVNNTSFGAELYGIYTLPKWTFTGTMTVGHLGNRATRNLPGVGAGKFATNGVYSGGAIRAEYDWVNRAHLFVTPYAGFSYLYTNTGSGQETGLNGPVNMSLHYGRMSSSLAQAGAGLTVGYRATTGCGLLTAWVRMGGLGTLGNTRAHVAETLGTVSGGATSQIASVGAFTPAIGVQLAGKNARWQLAANWQGQFAHLASSQAFVLQGSYKF